MTGAAGFTPAAAGDNRALPAARTVYGRGVVGMLQNA